MDNCPVKRLNSSISCVSTDPQVSDGGAVLTGRDRVSAGTTGAVEAIGARAFVAARTVDKVRAGCRLEDSPPPHPASSTRTSERQAERAIVPSAKRQAC